MKNEMNLDGYFTSELPQDDLLNINGGEDKEGFWHCALGFLAGVVVGVAMIFGIKEIID